MKPTKTLFYWAGSMVALMALAAGLYIGVGAERGTPPAQSLTLRIGVFPTQDFLPYFVMQEQGYARQEGLRFEEVAVAGGAGAIEGMTAGSVDMCPSVGSMPVLAAAQTGLIPEKVVAVAAGNFADAQHLGLAVLAGPEVKSWQDLRGKWIAVNGINSITGAAVRGRLKLEGVDDYTLVEMPFANLGLAVAGGNVAASGMSEPFLTQSLLRGDGKLLGWIAGGPPFERFPMTLVVFRSEVHRSNPKAVKAYLRAHLRAVRWIHRNEDGARAILARRLDLAPEVGRKISLTYWPLDARNDPVLLDQIQPVLAAIGALKAPIPARHLYDQTLLEEALNEKSESR